MNKILTQPFSNPTTNPRAKDNLNQSDPKFIATPHRCESPVIQSKPSSKAFLSGDPYMKIAQTTLTSNQLIASKSYSKEPNLLAQSRDLLIPNKPQLAKSISSKDIWRADANDGGLPKPTKTVEDLLRSSALQYSTRVPVRASVPSNVFCAEAAESSPGSHNLRTTTEWSPTRTAAETKEPALNPFDADSIFAKYLKMNKETNRVAQLATELSNASQTFTYNYARFGANNSSHIPAAQSFQTKTGSAVFNFRELQEHASTTAQRVLQASAIPQSSVRTNRPELAISEQPKTEIRRRFGKRKISQIPHLEATVSQPGLDGSNEPHLIEKSHQGRSGIVGQLLDSPLKRPKPDSSSKKTSPGKRASSIDVTESEPDAEERKRSSPSLRNRSGSQAVFTKVQPHDPVRTSDNHISRYFDARYESLMGESNSKLRALRLAEQRRMSSLTRQKSHLPGSSKSFNRKSSDSRSGVFKDWSGTKPKSSPVVKKQGQQLISRLSGTKQVVDLVHEGRGPIFRTATPGRGSNPVSSIFQEEEPLQIVKVNLKPSASTNRIGLPTDPLGSKQPGTGIATSRTTTRSLKQLVQEVPILTEGRKTTTIRTIDRKPSVQNAQTSHLMKPAFNRQTAGQLMQRSPQPSREKLDSKPRLPSRQLLFEDPPMNKSLLDTENEVPPSPAPKRNESQKPTLATSKSAVRPEPKLNAGSLGNLSKLMNFLERDEQLSQNKDRFRDHVKQFRREMHTDSESLLLDPSDHPRLTTLKVIKKLGDGSSAYVLLVTDQNGKKAALKVCDKGIQPKPATSDKPNPAPPAPRPHYTECALLPSFQHQNIIKLLDSFEGKQKFYLLLEYVGPNTLSSFLEHKKQRMDEDEAAHVFHEIGQALAYLHRMHIAHRDLKLHNIIIGAQGEVKLIDFGYGIKSEPHELTTTFCGTPSYMPPEVIDRLRYDACKSDVWSFGICLYRTLCGKFPFTGVSQTNLFYVIKKGNFDMPASLSDKASTLIRWTLKPDPQDRPTMEQILQHPWFSGVAFENTTADSEHLKQAPLGSIQA